MKDMIEEEVKDEQADSEVAPIELPRPTDPKWVEYVLDQLSDHELAGGAPTTDGLRRVCEKIYGEIVESDTQILEVPAKTGPFKASAKHTLIIRKYDQTREWQAQVQEVPVEVRVSACVDVLGDKLPAPFNQHLVSTACTRAEGKALRRALKIRVQTAEELSNKEEDELNTSEPINDQQIVAIKTLSKRNDVDLIKFVKANADQPKSIRDVNNLEGRLMINKLSTFQREGTPDELVGYNPNWEEEFGVK